jgi:hypothetical protein
MVLPGACWTAAVAMIAYIYIQMYFILEKGKSFEVLSPSFDEY